MEIQPASSELPRRSLAGLRALEARINAILPPRYQSCFDGVKPWSMGSADLIIGSDGKVAWDRIWTSFCDLALAGGPAHRGTLLEPVSAEEALAEPDAYRLVVEELERAVKMVTDLSIASSEKPGWIGVCCHDEAMARWLMQAIVVENVSARHEHEVLLLPAGPQFQLRKEIKNVVTALAKSCHYWTDHMPQAGQSAIATSDRQSLAKTTFLEPASPSEARAAPELYAEVVSTLEREARRATGLPTVPSCALGWVGLKCAEEETAVWLLRAIAVENVLVRREGDVIYLPAGPHYTRDEILELAAVLAQAHYYWNAHCSKIDAALVPTRLGS